MMIKMKNRSHEHNINSRGCRDIVNISMMSWYDNAQMY